MAIGYIYDDTFRLLGPTNLAPNPKRYGEYLLPANCTTVEPPSGYDVTKVPSFNQDTNEWVLVKSYYQLQLEDTYAEAVTDLGTNLYEQDIEGNWIERAEQIVNKRLSSNTSMICTWLP